MTSSGLFLYTLISFWGAAVIAQIFPFLPGSVDSPSTAKPITLSLRRVETKNRGYLSPAGVVKRQHLIPESDNNTALNNAAEASVAGLYEQEALVLPIQIGTPGVETLLLFDTGQGDTWVQTTAAGYNMNQSSTVATSPYSFNSSLFSLPMSHRTNASSGAYVADHITIGNVSLARQLFVVTSGAATDASFVDGVLGAAFPSLTMINALYNVSYLPLPFALYQARLVPKPVFSLSIGYGTVMFGGILQAQQTNEANDDDATILYTNITTTSFGLYRGWDIELQSISVGARSIVQFTTPVRMRIDTTTSYLIIPETIAIDLVINHLAQDAVRRDLGGYWAKCNSVPSILALGFPSSSSPQSNGSTIVTHLLKVNVSDLIVYADEGDKENCILAIEPSPSPSEYVIGTLALKNIITIFDFGQNRVGFSSLVNQDDG